MSKEEFKQATPVALDTNNDFCQKKVKDVSAIGTSPEFLLSNWDAGRFNFTNCYVFGENDALKSVYLYLIDGYSSSILLDALNRLMRTNHYLTVYQEVIGNR